MNNFHAPAFCRLLANLADIPYRVPAEMMEVIPDDVLSRLADDVDKIYAKTDISEPEKTQLVFSKYIEARIAYGNVSDVGVEELSTYMSSKYTIGPPGKLSASASGFSVPEELYNSPATLATLIHELEHNIQFCDYFKLQSGESPTPSDLMRTIYHMVFSPRSRYIGETGAMRAEWEFLQILPIEIKKAMIAQIEASSLSGRGKSFLIKNINSSNLSLEEYLSDQRVLRLYDGASLSISTPGITLVILGASLVAIYESMKNRQDELSVAPSPP